MHQGLSHGSASRAVRRHVGCDIPADMPTSDTESNPAPFLIPTLTMGFRILTVIGLLAVLYWAFHPVITDAPSIYELSETIISALRGAER